MRKKWRKFGLLYCPSSQGGHPKILTHVSNPLPILIKGDTYRIFYSGRDINNRSSVGAVDVDIVRRKVITEHYQPVFEHGLAGSFFADGVSIGNCYEVNDVRYMLFMGWQRPESGHWRGEIGRLIVHPDLSLELEQNVPLMGLDTIDPISLSYPWVSKSKTGGYNMWYGSTMQWETGNDEMVHVINYAVSRDGHHWIRKGLAIPFETGRAQAFSRPTVLEDSKGGYEMWFSYRGGNGKKYRIGRALSRTGKDWQLALDDIGIDISAKGWDSEMIEYPFVFNHKGQRYMLYNGNGYGLSGFGLAISIL